MVSSPTPSPLGRLQPDVAMADAQPDVAMSVPDAQPRHGAMSSPTPELVDQGVAWLIEHEPDKIWKQFPDHLAVAVEQAHIFTHKNTYTYTHTHVKRLTRTG